MAFESKLITMNIRRANSSDLPAVMEIVSLVVPIMQAAGNFQWDETYPNEEKFSQDILNDDLWVAESSEGAVCGVAALTADQSPEYSDCGWDLTETAIVPHRMAVHPSIQRSGIAKAFMKKAEELAVEKGFKFVRIDTNKLNTAMQIMFSKLGYEYSGEISLLRAKPELRFLCYQKNIQ